MLFDKIGYYLGTFTPVFMCSSASPVKHPLRFYLPLYSPPLLLFFIHFDSEASRGYLVSARVIERHHFSSSSGK